MAQFPVDYNPRDSEGVIEAINYLLSGPSGLGQNFSGSNQFTAGWLTGNSRSPPTRTPQFSQAVGGSGKFTITLDQPGGLTVSNGVQVTPLKVQVGMYASGLNIATGATVVYVNGTEITLSLANTGPVSGIVTFNAYAPIALYVAPITIGTIDWIDEYTVQVNFAAAQPTAPFEPGQTPTVLASTRYNGLYQSPGVVECTTTYVVLRRAFITANTGTGAGGTISYSNTIQPPAAGVSPTFVQSLNFNSTDARGTVIVNGAQDRVFISAQMNAILYYFSTAVSDFEYTVMVNRYKGDIPTVGAYNDTIVYNFDKTIAQKVAFYAAVPITAGSSYPIQEAIFGTVIDQPQSGAYLYRIDLLFKVTNTGGALQVTQCDLGLRSMSVQVVKQ
tara:strand:- start:331 stop:1494 length:1164 start_codon:yes stop_codon:yes gene_type:complete